MILATNADAGTYKAVKNRYISYRCIMYQYTSKDNV